MKRLTFLMFAFTASALADNHCPNLAGHYWCMIGPEELSELVVEQKTSGDITIYSYNYLAIPGEPDVFKASDKGEMDEFGYVTRCEGGVKTISSSYFDPKETEMFINRDDEHERRYDGVTVLKCPRKQSDRSNSH